MKKRSVRAVLGTALATLAVVALTSTSVGAVPTDSGTTTSGFGCATAAKGLTPFGECDVPTLRSGNGPTASCSGSYIFAWPSTGYGQSALATAVWSNSGPGSLPLPVAAVGGGRYAVTAVSYDGIFGRRGEIEPNEQFHVEFLNLAGDVVGTTSLSTEDLMDGFDEMTWSGSLGNADLTDAAVVVRAVHSFQGAGVKNTVQPVCVGLTLLATPTTTTTVPATTTTVAEVEGAVAVATPAAAVEGTPTFTG